MTHDKTLEPLTPAELNLLRRLRGLHVGNHLVTIQVTGEGVIALSVLTSAKLERLTPTSPPGTSESPSG